MLDQAVSEFRWSPTADESGGIDVVGANGINEQRLGIMRPRIFLRSVNASSRRSRLESEHIEGDELWITTPEHELVEARRTFRVKADDSPSSIARACSSRSMNNAAENRVNALALRETNLGRSTPPSASRLVSSAIHQHSRALYQVAERRGDLRPGSPDVIALPG